MQYSYSELLGMVEVLSDAGCSIARRVAISDVFASLQDSRALWVLDRVVEMNAEIIGRFNTASMLYTFTQNLFERYCCETAGCAISSTTTSSTCVNHEPSICARSRQR